MGNAVPWSKIASDPEIQQLNADDYDAIRRDYFDRVIAPELQTDEIDDVWADFDSRTARGIVGDAKAMVRRATGFIGSAQAPTPLPEEPSAPDLSPQAPAPSITGPSAPTAPTWVDEQKARESADSRLDAHPDFDTDFNTVLSQPEEAMFRQWKDRFAPRDSGMDYDLRGAFRAGVTPQNGHFPDTFKKPSHPTFSNESRYAKFGTPGKWDGDKFVPPDPEQVVIGGMIAQAEQDASRVAPDLTVPVEVKAKPVPPPGTPGYREWKAGLSAEDRAVVEADEHPAPQNMIDLRGAQVSDEAFAAIKQRYESASPQEREAMISGDGVQSRVARKIHESYGRMSEQIAKMPALSILDQRREARQSRYAEQGASAQTAANMAGVDLLTGRDTGLAATAQPSNFDFDTAKKYKSDGSSAQMVKRGAYLGVKQLKQQTLGLHEAIADAIGADEYAAVMGRGHKEAQQEIETIGTGKTAFERNFEGAISSIISQGPVLAIAVGTGAQTVPLLMMSAQVFGQEYASGKAAGLSKPAALARAGIQGAFEFIGKRLSLGATTKALREGIRRAVDNVRGAPIDATRETLGNLFLKSLAKENVGEVFTSSGQFWSDAFPGIGLNPDATFDQYLTVIADTIVQTTLQTGIMAGAGMGPAVITGRPNDTEAVARAESAKEKALLAWDKAFHPEGRREPGGIPVDRAPGAPSMRTANAPVEPIQGMSAERAPLSQQAATEAGVAGTEPDDIGEYQRQQLGIENPVGNVGVTAGQEKPKPGGIAVPQGVEDILSREEPVIGDTTAEEPPQPPAAEPLTEAPPQKAYTKKTAEVKAKGLTKAGNPSRVIPHPTEDGKFAVVPKEADATTEQQPPPEAAIPAQKEGVSASTPVDAAAHEAATSPTNDTPQPTEGQKKAGNYRKGAARISGLDISIENPEGSKRSGTDPSGKAWSVTMKSHYGYIRGTVGRDKDHVDVFVKPGTPEDYAGPVFVIDQSKPGNGHFDEHKVMLGWTMQDAAVLAYKGNYAKGWNGLGAVTKMSMDEFKGWLESGDTTKPAADHIAGAGKKVPDAEGGAPTPDADPIADAGKPIAGDSVPREAKKEVRIGGYPVSGMGDKALKLAAKKAATPEQREAAQAELARRAAVPKQDEAAPGTAAPAGQQEAEEPIKAYKSADRAKLEAKKLSRLGAPSKVIPHPTEQGKFAVVPREVKPRSEAQKANDARLKEERGAVNPARDSMFAAIGKLGGINRAAAASEWGIDPEDRPSSGVIGKPVLRTNGGLSVDAMLEALAELGYVKTDEHGKADMTELEELFRQELFGDKVYTPAGLEIHAGRQVASQAEEHALADAEFSDEELAEDGYNDLSDDERTALDEYLAHATRVLGEDFIERIKERVAVETEGMSARDYGAALRKAIDEELRQAESGIPGKGQESRGQPADAARAEDRQALSLEAQTPEELKAREDAAKAAEDEKRREAEKAERDRKAAENKAEKDRRAAAIIAEDKARREAEVKALQNPDDFQFGADAPAAPAPVIKKVSTEQARGQGDIFAQPAAGPAKTPPAVSPNTIFTEDAAEAARALLRKKLGQLNTGLDPEVMQAGITLAGYHVEKGARTFAAFAKAMIEDLGDAVKPYLKSLYAAARFDPRSAAFAHEMDSLEAIERADLDAIIKTDPVVERFPGESGTEIHVIRAKNGGYTVGMMDTDINQYMPTLRKFSGEGALEKATDYAKSIAKPPILKTGGTKNVADERGSTNLERDRAKDAPPIQQVDRDYSDAEDIKAFFERIENASIPDRAQPVSSPAAQPAAQQGAQPAAQPEGKKYVTDAPEVEYVTRKGKTLRGVIATGLTDEQAKEFDPYTWKKDGGYFIRMAHVERPGGPGGDGAARFSRIPEPAGIGRERALADVQTLNDAIADAENDNEYRNAYLPAELDDPGIARAFESTFGVTVVPVRPSADKFNDRLAMQHGGKIYVNIEGGEHGFVQLAGHELLHQIRKEIPSVYDWFAEQAENYLKKNSEERYRLRLEAVGAKGFDTREEILADFVGDSLADPDFLAHLAERNKTKFRLFIDRVIGWLNETAKKLTKAGFGSYEYFNDVKALQGYLGAVLNAYKTGGERDVAPPKYSRAFKSVKTPKALTAYREIAQRAIDQVDRIANPFIMLPGRKEFMAKRGLTQGRIDEINDINKSLRKAFLPASEADRKAVFSYLITEGATTKSISDPKIAGAAKDAKDLIRRTGDAMVARGMLDEETRRDSYLPQVYLKYMLDAKDYRALGSGKKPSNMSYLLKRKYELKADQSGKKVALIDRDTGLPVSDEVILSLGPVTDPTYLSGLAIARPLRDMALLDWLSDIARGGLSDAEVRRFADLDARDKIGGAPLTKDEAKELAELSKRYTQWVLPGSTVQWNGRTVSSYWLKEEAARIRKQARYYEGGGKTIAANSQAGKALALADKMDDAADKALDGLPGDKSDYRQMPTSPRMGRMSGVWVRKEIYNDIMGVNDFMPTSPGWAQRILGYGGEGTKAVQIWKMMKVTMNLPGQVRNFASNLVLLNLSGVPAHRIPGLAVKAIDELIHDGRHWKIAKKYGVRASTFSAQELQRLKTEFLEAEKNAGRLTIFGVSNLMARKTANFAGDIYQLTEALSKTAKIMYEMENGASESDAVDEAQRWLFDYSNVPQSVRYLRGAPVGVPFACVDDKTEALTKDGWKGIDAIVDGDEVASFDMETQRLAWKPVKSVYRSEYEGPMVHVHDRHLDMMLTPDHRCVSYRRRRVVGMREINAMHLNLEVVKARDLNVRDHIPVAAEFDRSNEGEPLSNGLVKVLGWVATEGYFHKLCDQVHIYQNASGAQPIRDALTEAGMTWLECVSHRAGQQRVSNGVIVRHNEELVTFQVHAESGRIIRALLPGKKLTPALLHKLTRDQIDLLIETMIDGDGCRSGSQVSFIQKGGETAEAFKMALVMSGRSFGVHLRAEETEQISIRDGKRYCVKRALGDTVQYKGRIWCPEVPGFTTWVARRDDKVFITGNTFPTKVLPRLIEVAALHPQRYLPWAGLFFGLQYGLAALLDVDYDDLEKLRKAMPKWIQKAGHAVLLPWKDEFGKWQVVDLSYFMPWTYWTNLAKDVGRGELGEAFRDTGAVAGPMLDLATAWRTGKDPFTQRDIADPGDSAGMQALSWLNYHYSLVAPPMLTSRGTLGKAVEAYTGETNRFGDPKRTATQAAWSLFGVNINSIDPARTRNQNMKAMEREISDSVQRTKERLSELQGPGNEEKRNAALGKGRAEAEKRRAALQKYMEESEIPESLR